MKDAKFTLEFTTHVLANSASFDDKPDKFNRDSTNKMIWQQSWWYSAFAKAIELAHVRGVKAGDIHMDLTVEAPTQMYKRRYGDDEYRVHEAIMPGTTVVFNAVVADNITTSILKTLLERMGKYIGLSPYGYRLGFGKFNVIDVEVAPSDATTPA